MSQQQEAEEAAKEFLSIPWTRKYLEQPNVCWAVASSRHRKNSNEDALLGKTFNSPDTIGSCVSVYTKPGPDAGQITEVHTLMSIGTALDGWPQILHGGVVATVIDESMGILLGTRIEFHRKNPGRNKGLSEDMAVVDGKSFTAYLNITYKAPVRTPGPLIVSARIAKQQGRKEWISAELKQYDAVAGKEIVCSTAEALFIATRPKL